MAFERLLAPGRIGRIELGIRAIVAPMTRISATEDGLATPDMAAYYARYAEGGFPLVVTEGLYPDEAHAQCYRDQPGLATDAQAASWAPVVEAVHAAGGRIVAQLMHAGAVALHNRYTSERIAPSVFQPPGEQPARYHGRGPYPLPREIAPDEIAAVQRAFAAAARRAAQAGFDGVEIHGANGYLIDQFLTSYANRRGDRWGGPIENRVRFAVETVEAALAAVPAGFPVGIRISQTKVNDLSHAWEGGVEDARAVFGALGETGLAFVHVSSHLGCGPVFGSGASLAGLAKRYSGKTIVANGKLHDPAAAEELLARGEADFVSIAKGALADPDWPRKVARGEPPIPFDPGMIEPLATIENTRRWRAERGERTQ